MQPLDQLKQALAGDNAEGVRQLLAAHPGLKAKLNEPIGPFNTQAIVNARSAKMVDVLLDAGADINARSLWWAGGFGVLHCASPEVAAHAIERGAVVDAHAAARLGMLDRLQSLVEKDPSLVHARGGDGQTPLHSAANVKIADCLLSRGADIDARDVDHESTPAQYMVKDRPEVTRFLIGRGCKTDLLMAAALGDPDLVRRHLDADPNCIRLRVNADHFPMSSKKAGGTIYQWTIGPNLSAHQIAKQKGHAEILKLLLERSPADVRLLTACWFGDAAEGRAILAQEPKIASRLTESDRRQVVDAARNNDLGALGLMLQAGLPVDAVDSQGATALHWAAFYGNREMAELLVAHKSPLDAEDGMWRRTPLGWATYGSSESWAQFGAEFPGVVETILKAGAARPEKLAGSEAVQAILRKYGVQ